MIIISTKKTRTTTGITKIMRWNVDLGKVSDIADLKSSVSLDVSERKHCYHDTT